MRVLLVMPDYHYGGPYAISLGLMYLSSYLKRAGWDVATLNLNHHPPGRLAEVLAAGRFDVVATGGMFTYFPQLRGLVAAVRRESPGSRVVLGGPIASADPEFALEALAPDALVIGEGERPMDGLLRAWAEGGAPEAVPGVAVAREGRLVKTGPAELVSDLDRLPWPDYEGFEFGRFLERSVSARDPLSVSPHAERRAAPVISGRGCAARCTFCYRLTPSYRHRAVADVIREIEHLRAAYGVNEVLVWDDLFSVTQDRILDFCARIRPLGLTWGCQLRVPVVTASLLRTMKDSGCNLISYGLESASPAVLRSMRKGISVEKMEAALALTHEAGITIQGNFIFGDPAETWETAQETLAFYRRHRRDFGNSISLGIVVPYPGTSLYRDLRARGRLRNLQRFYETGRDERGRWINMTSMPEARFRRLLGRLLPAEERRCRLFGRVLGARRAGPDLYEFSYVCPLCGGRSDGCRLELSAARPVSCLRLACRLCRQRSYVPARGLLGWRRAAVFAALSGAGALWRRCQETDLFAALRYHPAVDGAWNAYKERLRADGAHFNELRAAPAFRARLGFARNLARDLLVRAGGKIIRRRR
ncbi:MAG: radical SAM protein [Elusimicrobia bacterium]|nr:radical SAM protein [Elusimicrobiota bacterium]